MTARQLDDLRAESVPCDLSGPVIAQRDMGQRSSRPAVVALLDNSEDECDAQTIIIANFVASPIRCIRQSRCWSASIRSWSIRTTSITSALTIR